MAPGDSTHSPSPHPNPLLILLAGPTAVGKSAVALRVAGQLEGEFISVDSMQVYRGLDIGTAKPTPEQREHVRHHLIDVVDVTEPFNAAQFARLAHEAVREIQLRGHMPILCGGTGLYFKAFLEGLGETPAADPALRAELEQTPLPDLLRELAVRDPAAFQAIDRQNPRRVVRALEVIRLSGRPFSAQRSPWGTQASSLAPRPSPLFLGLSRDAADLRARIDARVDEMFRLGLVQETEALLRRGLAQNRTALQAIGYRQVVEYLRGERSLAETIALVKQRTRQFAKRQMTWFRKHAVMTWLRVPADAEAASAADSVVDLWRQQTRSLAAHPST